MLVRSVRRQLVNQITTGTLVKTCTVAYSKIARTTRSVKKQPELKAHASTEPSNEVIEQVNKQSNSQTPLQKQWQSIKDAHPEHLILFRLGDFYEMFADDALKASEALSITLTSRLGVSMCGFPQQSLDTQVRRLIQANYTVAICEQSADSKISQPPPTQSKSRTSVKPIAERNVVRIVTPGTSLDDAVDSPKQFHFLVAMATAPHNSATSSSSDHVPATEPGTGTHSSETPWISLAWVDVSTGLFNTTSLSTWSEVSAELARLSPAELLVSDTIVQQHPQISSLISSYRTTFRPDMEFNGDMKSHIDRWQTMLRNEYEPSQPRVDATVSHSDSSKTGLANRVRALHPEHLVMEHTSLELLSCSALLSYLFYTQRTSLPCLYSERESTKHASTMQIDAATRRSLELSISLSRNTRTGSLIHAVDRTETNAGARMLSSWIAAPLTDVNTINERLELVQLFHDDPHALESMRRTLKRCGDIDRSLQKLVMNKGVSGARELRSIANTLKEGKEIARVLHAATQARYSARHGEQITHYMPPPLAALLDLLSSDSLAELQSELDRALVDEPPTSNDMGHFIRTEYSTSLAELYALTDSGQDAINALQQLYRNELNVPSLKIKKNSGVGYFIEVSAARAPALEHERNRIDNTIQKSPLLIGLQLCQQLKTANRYNSTTLSELQNNLMNANERALEAEMKIFEKLRGFAVSHASLLASFSRALATIDVLGSLAHIARDSAWSRPEFVTDQHDLFECREGRHPVVEARLNSSRSVSRPQDAHIDFTANDCVLDSKMLICLLSGANMSGKSTYLRQNALIALLASIGSFVPCDSLRLSPVDAIFCRIGGAVTDDLSRDQSTFMAEMLEISAILSRATSRSFVVVDECGRGTSTFDGLSIALATLEHMHDVIKCRTIFATHYHELSIAAPSMKQLACYRMAVNVNKDASQVTFLHSVEPGTVQASYGIHVARMAMLPVTVTNRATELLNKLQEGRNSYKHLVETVLVHHSKLDRSHPGNK